VSVRAAGGATERGTGLPVALGYAALAVAAGLAIGAGVAMGFNIKYLIAAAIAPFVLVLVLARPHLAVTAYVVIVYADVLSLLVQYQGMPPLARFAGIALLSAVAGYRLIILRDRLVSDPLTWWMAGYGIVLALGLLYARRPDLVMDNVIEFTRNFLTYLLIINTLTSMARLRTALWASLGMGALMATLTLYQSVTGNFNNEFGGLAQYRVSEIASGSDAPRPSGPVADANYYGQLLLIVLPLSLYLIFEGRSRLVRLLGVGASLALVAALVFTYSRGDALALILMLALAVAYKRPHPALLIAGVVGLAAVVPFLPQNYVARLSTVIDVATGNEQTILTESSIRGRAGAIQAAVAMFADHPILGVGRENYPLYQAEYLAGTRIAYQSKAIPPHDLYLEIAAEHGIIGIIVWGGALVAAFAAIRETRRRFKAAGQREGVELAAWLGIGLIGYLASSLFLHGAFQYMLWLQISFIAALRQVARRNAPVLPLDRKVLPWPHL
jgi:O-antigen ligase